MQGQAKAKIIILREFKLTDAEAIARHANNRNVSRYLRDIFPYPYTLEDARWWVTQSQGLGNTLNLAIDIDGRCVGGIGLQFQADEHKYSCELGYWLGESCWGKGIATIAIAQMRKIAFSAYPIKRLYATTASTHHASKRVLEKNGFQLEGVLKNHLYLRDELYDQCIYAVYS